DGCLKKEQMVVSAIASTPQRYNERIKGKRQEWGILCNND
ncbi:hypothetical protein, partial [Shigella sonnei]